MVVTVLVHDREPFLAAVAGAALRDVDDARIEVAVLAGDALVDGVRDDVRDAAPVVRHRVIGEPDHLLFGEHVPEPELGPEPSVGNDLDPALDQRLRVDHAPIAEARQVAERFRGLDKGLGIDRAEQAGAFQVGGDDAGDVAAVVLFDVVATEEMGDGDRHRLDRAAGDVDAQFGPGRIERPDRAERRAGRDPRRRPAPSSSLPAQVLHHKISFGSKFSSITCQIS